MSELNKHTNVNKQRTSSFRSECRNNFIHVFISIKKMAFSSFNLYNVSNWFAVDCEIPFLFFEKKKVKDTQLHFKRYFCPCIKSHFNPKCIYIQFSYSFFCNNRYCIHWKKKKWRIRKSTWTTLLSPKLPFVQLRFLPPVAARRRMNVKYVYSPHFVIINKYTEMNNNWIARSGNYHYLFAFILRSVLELSAFKTKKKQKLAITKCERQWVERVPLPTFHSSFSSSPPSYFA